MIILTLKKPVKKVLLSLILLNGNTISAAEHTMALYLPCPGMYHRLARPYIMVSGIGKNIMVLN